VSVLHAAGLGLVAGYALVTVLVVAVVVVIVLRRRR